jgi:hypothetical protein
MRAISVRQPHAWAIIHGGKDVENRSQRAALQFKPAIGERVLIHASKRMTADEYAVAVAFMASIGVRCPQRDGLQFGGVIGSVFVRDIVSRSDSPWFRKGATALVFADARPEPFLAARGWADYTAPRGRLPGSDNRSNKTAERTRSNSRGLLFCQRGGFQG